jgi:pyruvate/2-oxoglutarate dehydrogenase complex dihydrolipoamide dehydrogenase (E3) component
VVATGAEPSRPPIPGSDLPHVQAAVDFLDGAKAEVRRPSAAPAVVLGGGWIGCHAADVLTSPGYAVTVVDTREALGYDMGGQQGMVLRDRVAQNCTVKLRTSVDSITTDLVTVWDSLSDRTYAIPATKVLVAARMEPRRSLVDAILGHCSAQVRCIGDASEPRKLADALLDGARIAQVI